MFAAFAPSGLAQVMALSTKSPTPYTTLVKATTKLPPSPQPTEVPATAVPTGATADGGATTADVAPVYVPSVPTTSPWTGWSTTKKVAVVGGAVGGVVVAGLLLRALLR